MQRAVYIQELNGWHRASKVLKTIYRPEWEIWLIYSVYN
jgi:hypothetical protein